MDKTPRPGHLVGLTWIFFLIVAARCAVRVTKAVGRRPRWVESLWLVALHNDGHFKKMEKLYGIEK
jgi:hypothetical protein